MSLLDHSQSFAIIIPYYCGHDYIQELLDSLDMSTRMPDHVILVDNGPEEDRLVLDTLNLNHRFELWLLTSAPKLGFGRACNLGAHHAREVGTNAFIVLNQDTHVYPDMCEHLLTPLFSGEADVTGPLQVHPATEEPSEFFITHYLHQPPSLRSCRTREEIPQGQFPMSMLSAACLAMRTKMLDEVGLFDPLYRMYGEDNDLARRMREGNKTQVLCTRALLAHAHSNAHDRSDQVLAWVLESGSIRILRSQGRHLGAALAYQVARRAWHYGRTMAQRNRDMIPYLIDSDRYVSSKLSDFQRARRGETAKTRMQRCVSEDRARTTVTHLAALASP